MSKLLFVDSNEFKEKRYEYITKLSSKGIEQEFLFQLCDGYKTKWLPFMEFSKDKFIYVDEIHRSILNNEVVFDVDIEIKKEGKIDLLESIHNAKEIAKLIIDKLDNLKLKYSIYYSGNKGFHIHFLITHLDLEICQLKELAELKNRDEKYFFRIFKESIYKFLHIPRSFGKSIDKAKFNKKTMIRLEGAINPKNEFWKSYITKEELINFDHKKYGSHSSINFNYLNEQNNLNKSFSNFIYDQITESFNSLHKGYFVVSKYKSNKGYNIEKYSKVFKNYYTPGRMHFIGTAYVCFLYLATDGNEEKAKEYYHSYLGEINPKGLREDYKFNQRFTTTWKSCSEADRVGFYKFLERNCSITKDDFKEALKNV